MKDLARRIGRRCCCSIPTTRRSAGAGCAAERLSVPAYLPIALAQVTLDLRIRVSFETVARGRHPPRLADALVCLFLNVVIVVPLMLAAVAALKLDEGAAEPVPNRDACLGIVGRAWSAEPSGGRDACRLSRRAAARGAWRLSQRRERRGRSRVAAAELDVRAPLYLQRRREEAIRALRDAKLQRLNAETRGSEKPPAMRCRRRSSRTSCSTRSHTSSGCSKSTWRTRPQDAAQPVGLHALGAAQMRGQTISRSGASSRSRAPTLKRSRSGWASACAWRSTCYELLKRWLPSLTVLTLARRHQAWPGPKREGGTLRIDARLRDALLEEAVCDDGVGLRLGAGTGHGLSNTRRVSSADTGARAALDIEARAAGGVRAALRCRSSVWGRPGRAREVHRRISAAPGRPVDGTGHRITARFIGRWASLDWQALAAGRRARRPRRRADRHA